jgi:hypothetical protein
MDIASPPTPPAGWYDDPHTLGAKRYWTGDVWAPPTQQVAPQLPYGAAAAVDPTTGNALGGWALGLGITAFVLWWVPFLFVVTSIAGGVVAIVLGVQGRARADSGLATNRSMATVGMVLGIVGLVFAGLNGVIGAILGGLGAL